MSVLDGPKLHHVGRPGRWPGTRELMPSTPYIVPHRVAEEAIEILLDPGPEITPRAAGGDRNHDAKHNRAAARERDIAR